MRIAAKVVNGDIRIVFPPVIPGLLECVNVGRAVGKVAGFAVGETTRDHRVGPTKAALGRQRQLIPLV